MICHRNSLIRCGVENIHYHVSQLVYNFNLVSYYNNNFTYKIIEFNYTHNLIKLNKLVESEQDQNKLIGHFNTGNDS